MKTIVCIVACLIIHSFALSQTPKRIIPADTVYVFESPRPLITDASSEKAKTVSRSGVDVLFSGSGFGIGGYYQRPFGDDFVGFVSAAISGARNTSEFETGYNPTSGQFYVPGKVNRLYMLPVTVGLNLKVFQDVLTDNLRPYISAGVAPTFIFSAPYDQDLFQSWGNATSYMRVGVFAGIGTYIGTPSKGSLGVNIRYYFIPFGGDGLESIRELPIRDFGGLFISLSIGFGR